MAKKKLFSGVKNFVKNTEYVKEQKPKTVSLGSSLQNTYKSSEPVQRQMSERERAEKERSNKMRSSALVSIAKTMSKNRASNYKTTLPSVASKLRAQSASQAPKYKSSSSMASVLKSQTKAQAPKTSVSSAMASKMKSQTKVQAPKSRVTNTMAKNALAPVNKYAESHMVTGGHGVGTYGFKTSVRQKALAPAKEIAEYTRKQQNKYVYTPNNDYRFDANGNMLTKKDPISIEYGKKLRAGMPSKSTAIMSWRGNPSKEELKYRDKYGYTQKAREALDTRLNENMLEATYSPTTGEITPSKHGRALLAGHSDTWSLGNIEDTYRKQYGIDLDKETLDKIKAQRETANYTTGSMIAQAEQYAATRGLLGAFGLVGKAADAISDSNKVVRFLTNKGVKTGTAKAITALMEEMGIDQAASVPLNLVDAMKADGGANVIKRFGINQGLDVLFSGLSEIPSLRRNLHFLNGNEMNEAANAMQEGTEKISTKIGAKNELDVAVNEAGDAARNDAIVSDVYGRTKPVNRKQAEKIAPRSVVRADNGELQIMYHGSADDFWVFDKNKIREVDYDAPFNGFWFSSSDGTNPAFSGANYRKAFYLNIQNPAPYEVWRAIDNQIVEDGIVREGARSYNDELRYRLQDMGYDGIHWDGSYKFTRENLDEFNRLGKTTFTDGRGVKHDLIKESDGAATLVRSGLDPEYHMKDQFVNGEDFFNINNSNSDYRSTEIWVAFEPDQMIPTRKQYKGFLSDADRLSSKMDNLGTKSYWDVDITDAELKELWDYIDEAADRGIRGDDAKRYAYRRMIEKRTSPDVNNIGERYTNLQQYASVDEPVEDLTLQMRRGMNDFDNSPSADIGVEEAGERFAATQNPTPRRQVYGELGEKNDESVYDATYRLFKNWGNDDASRNSYRELVDSYRNMSPSELAQEKDALRRAVDESSIDPAEAADRTAVIDAVAREKEKLNTTGRQPANAEPKVETPQERVETPRAEAKPKEEPKTKAQAEQQKAKVSNSASDEEIDRLVREQTKEMYDKMSTKELNAELRRLENNPTVTPDVEGADEMGIKEAMDSDEVAERTDIINEILAERGSNGSVKPNVDRSKEEVFVSEEQVDKVFNDAIRKRSYRFETLRAYPRSGDMRIIIGDRAYDERGFRRLIREDLERTKAQVNEAINARAAKVGKQKASVEEPKTEPKAEAKAEPSSAWDEIENEVDNIPTKEPPNKLKGTKSAEKVPEGVERLDSETQEAIEKSKRMTQKEKEASKKAGDYPSGMPKEMDGQPLNKGFDSITRKDADTSDAAVLDIMESVTMGNEGRKVSKGVKETQEEAAARWANDTDTSLKKITAATEGLKDGAMPKGYETFQEYFADVKEGMKYYRKLQEEAGEGTDAYWKAVENEADIARGAAKVTSNMGAGFRQYQEILGASPKARVIIVQKEVDKIKKQFEKLLKGKDIKPLSPEVTKMLEEAKTPVQQAEALEQASIEIWSQIPASMKEKADQWRMTSMLLNPKTHFRNIIGNFLFRPAILIKDALSVPAEKALIKAGKIDPEDATKAFVSRLNAKDREYRDAAKKVWNEYQTLIRRSGGKYFDTVDSKGFLTSRPLEVGRFTAGKEDPNAVQRALDFLAKKNGDALEAEDAFFMKGKFVDSYSKILKARKLDPSKMTDEQMQEVIEDAAQEALRSTYRDASGLANAINKARNYKPNASAGRKVAGWAVDATLPFVKTPVNILRRAKDYSPVGFIEGAAKLTKALSKGDSKAATEAIDRMASGLTGGGICALGLFLGQNGMLDSKLEDGSEGFYKQDIGYQNYSLKLGGEDGVSISLNWAAPLSIPLFTGVEYAKMRENGLSLKDWVKFVDVAGRIFDPTMEMSVMQGPMALLEAISDGENGGDKLLKGGLSVGLNYVGQYYPTISGQAARTIDPVRRNTSSTAESPTGRALEKWKNKQIAKTPFLSQTLEPYVNVWGEEQKTTDNGLLRFAYEFGSPAYVNKIKADEVDKEIIRLNKAAASDEDKIIPSKYFSNAVSFDGGKVSLDAKDLTLYNKIKGKASKEAIRKLIKTEEYKNANNDGKREMINDVMKNANTEAKQKTLIKKGKDEWDVYTEGFTGGWKEQASTAKDAGIKAEQYYKIKTDKSVDLDENGGKSQYEVYTYLEGTDLTKSQKSALWNAYNKGWKNNPYEGGDIPEAPDPDDVELAAAKKEAKTLSKAKARAEGSLAAKAFEKSVLKRATETASLLEDSGKSKSGSSRRGRSGRRGGGGSGSSKRKQTASERKFANGTGKLSSVDLEKIYKQTQGKQTKLPTTDLIKIYEQAKIKPAKVPTTSLVKAYTQVQQASKTKTPTPMDIKVKGLTKSQKKAMLKVMLKKLDTKR